MEKVTRGHIIKGYRLEKIVGMGGYTLVYSAAAQNPHPIYGEKIAVKVLLDRRKNKKGIRDLSTEAKIALSFDHPNVVRIYDLIQRNGHYFLLMELLDMNATTYLRGLQEPSLEKAMLLAVGAARGLAYIHRRGIVHRDVKESNILVSSDLSRVKITDFGLSEDSRKSVLRRNVFQLRGTTGYIAPEQRQNRTADRRSDIFAFGKTVENIFRLAGVEKPPGINYLVSRATASEPEDRFQEMSEVVEHLKKLYPTDTRT